MTVRGRHRGVLKPAERSAMMLDPKMSRNPFDSARNAPGVDRGDGVTRGAGDEAGVALGVGERLGVADGVGAAVGCGFGVGEGGEIGLKRVTGTTTSWSAIRFCRRLASIFCI
jgi:hypothetical protein